MQKTNNKKSEILECILNSKLNNFDCYENDQDWNLLSQYYGFYKLTASRKKNLISKCLKEYIKDMKKINKK